VAGRAGAPAGTLDAWWEGLERAAGELQTDTQVEVGLTVASHNRGTTFDDAVRSALTDAAGRAGLSGPEIVCFAGHDAGVIGQQRPAGMVLVRNRSGVSHAPAEHIELDDAAEAANLVQTAVESLA
jgi:N-carbamoyl-L-amino-acid hydrolase